MMGPVTYFSLCLLGCLIFNPLLEASPRREHSLRIGSGTNATACARGWEKHGDNCYKFYPQKVVWSVAEEQCQSHQPEAHLVSILSDAERRDVGEYLNKLTSTEVWIGLHSPCKGNCWVWTDGSPFRYKTWMPNEPNNLELEEYCVEVYKTTGYKDWNDKICSTKNTYICKYKP